MDMSSAPESPRQNSVSSLQAVGGAGITTPRCSRRGALYINCLMSADVFDDKEAYFC